VEEEVELILLLELVEVLVVEEMLEVKQVL
jgi:hypothetical protein